MIQQATAEMEAMQPRLKEIAGGIRGQKNSFFKILKSIISVVGAVLSPITGGITSMVAGFINKGIDIAQNVSNLNFGDLAQTAAGIAGAVVVAANLGDQVTAKFGGADLKKTAAEFKSWVNSTKGDIERIGNDARRMLDGLKGLEKEVAGRYATAILNDLPITIKDNTARIGFGPKAVALQGVLQDHLRDILRAGGVVAGDLKARVEGLTKLPLLDDATLKSELKKAVDEVIVALPDDLLAKVHGEVATAKRIIETKKNDLKREIDNGEQKVRQSLAKILGGGLTIVLSSDNRVLAVERPIKKEAEAFQERLKAVKNELKLNVLGDLAKSIQDKMKDIQVKAESYQRGEDDKGLDDLAASIPGRIDTVKAELNTINDKITEAQGKLEDAGIGVEVATFHKNSLDLMIQAQMTNQHVQKLERNVADLKANIADLKAQQATLVRLQHGEMVRAKQIHFETAQAEVRHISEIGTLQGIDLSGESPKLL
jgi:hypothetical protein